MKSLLHTLRTVDLSDRSGRHLTHSGRRVRTASRLPAGHLQSLQDKDPQPAALPRFEPRGRRPPGPVTAPSSDRGRQEGALPKARPALSPLPVPAPAGYGS